MGPQYRLQGTQEDYMLKRKVLKEEIREKEEEREILDFIQEKKTP